MTAQQLTATGLQHLGLPAKNFETSVNFYKNLGFEVEWQSEPGAQNTVAFMRLGSLMMEIYPAQQTAQRPGSIDHVAINVQDVEAAFALIKQAGYPLVDAQIQQLPFYDKGVRFFTFLGPDGEKLEMNQLL